MENDKTIAKILSDALDASLEQTDILEASRIIEAAIEKINSIKERK